MVEHRFIGIFGMMGSGKSVLMNEYLIERPMAREVDFVPPPVEAKFRGMDFEFVDQVFALQNGNLQFNFYELDAPTINKWTQFITIADTIIVAYNFMKDDYFESPEKFIKNIETFSDPEAPLFFVINACNDLEKGKEKLEQVFHISNFSDRDIDIRNIPEVTIEYTQDYGRRYKIDINRLDELYQDVINKLS